MRFDALANFILLPDLTFLHSFWRKRKKIFVYATKVHSQVCPRCAAYCSSTYDHRVVEVKDEPLRGRGTILHIRKRRLWCKPCHKPFMECIGGIAKRSRTTERYKRAILAAAENFTDLERVRTNYQCSDGYLYRALYEMLELERRKCQYPWPKVIGVDEHSFRRDKRRKIGWATVLVDVKNDRLFEIVDGKSGDDLNAALRNIPGRDNVRFVAMDMADSYRAFVRGFFPKAEIVADKFHVIRLLSKALNRSRLDVTGVDKKTPIRSLLLRNAEDLEEYETSALKRWLNENHAVRELYHFKESIRGFYRIKGYERARRAFIKIVDRMGASSLQSVATIRTTLLSWRNEVLAYFKTGLTNSMAEGFNNKAKLVQRKAYGLRSFEHYRLRILNACR